jgi:hypothetical protein
MATSTRVTTAYVDILATPSNAEVRTNQYAVEIAQTPATADLNVKGFDVEVLLAGPAEAAALSNIPLVFTISGTSYVNNFIGNTPLTASAGWGTASYGTAPFTFDWQLSNTENEAGFVSTATTASIARTYTNAGGTRGISATISDVNSTVSVTTLVYVKAEQTPNPFDGVFQGESQARRRVFP